MSLHNAGLEHQAGSGLFQNGDGFGGGGGTAMLSLDRALPDRVLKFGRAASVLPAAPRSSIDVLPDLGVDIGSRSWWRGVAGCLTLCGVTLALSPGFKPLVAIDRAPLGAAAWDEARAQSIAPLAWGADTGRRMAATDAVQPLADTPDRPQIDLTATLGEGEGDGLARALQRSGVAGAEADRVAAMVANVVDSGETEPGTALAITLGRRASRSEPRPLQTLAFRARFDLRLEFERVGNALAMRRLPVAVDRTPLRVDGFVGSSLYATARAAGAPGSAVQSYLRALAPKVPIDDIGASDRFTLIVEQQRAETGEVKYGKLLYVGLDSGARATRMIQWTVDGRTDWFDAAGVGQRRGGFQMPVENARKTSGFGMRIHPLFGYSRFHRGTDYGAASGTPIRAVTDGVVTTAGWQGGYGRMVRLAHAGGLGSGYAHMSSIAVSHGAQVRQGQVIGYVGSSGFSTGPHLHFEVYRGGQAVAPSSVRFESTAMLQGAELAAFRSRLDSITGTRVRPQQIASR